MEPWQWYHFVVATLGILVLVVAVGVFVVDVEAGEPGPVSFEDTVSLGLTDAERQAMDDDVYLPKAQVFYSDYRYVVGYYGMETLHAALDDDRMQWSLGDPLAIYVTDFSRTELTLDTSGHPTPANPPTWTTASTAVYVVDSDARAPTGDIAIPFSSPDDAQSYTESYGGTVVSWSELRDRDVEGSFVDDAGDDVPDRHERADDRLDDAVTLLDRPTSLTVGEDAPSIQAAVDQAPNGTTVVVPPGTYNESIEITRPITLRGEGAIIDGGGDGDVVSISAPDVAVTGFTIVGVGDQLQDPDAATDDPDAWDHNIELGYGHGDAGIAVVDSVDPYIADVHIDTPASGVLLRDAPGAVVHKVSIEGSEEWRDGFMGIMAMRSPGVIEDVQVQGGRDGVYTHRSDGIVVRDSTFQEGRFGVHLMHSSETLIANSTSRDQLIAGFVIMTDPEQNAIVGNEVRDSESGIITVGTGNYIAHNLVVDTDTGLRSNDHSSRYEHNAIVDNNIGVSTGGFIPTNVVVNNDFIGNNRHVSPGFGPLEVWAEDGVGNYWDGAIGMADGDRFDRPFSPTDPVDARLNRVDGAQTLANAPGLEATSRFADTIPGLRAGVIDPYPRVNPANPNLLEQLAATSDIRVVPP